MVFLSGGRAGAAPAFGESGAFDFFEKRIRPQLAKNCYQCHSEAAGKKKGGLWLDRREAVLAGGDSGPALVPGNSERSLLLKALSHRDPDLKMPPKRALEASVVEDFRRWIASGAPDPRTGPDLQAAATGIDYEKGRQFWSFQALRSPPVPVNNAVSPIDRFIHQRLSESDLKPVGPAEERVLVRRLYFDLTGLPPTPVEMEAYLADSTPDKYERLVDRLLDSRSYAERWGRHWLDVTRFAESSGGGRAMLFPKAWRFRDYVIRSFQNDKPFNELVREHVAGDLLEGGTAEERRDRLIATGVLALGPTNFELQDKELLRLEVIDEQIDTIGRAFLGMTIGCARCHDHFFDPISIQDYYALAGIFRNTRSLLYGNVSSWIHRELPLPAGRELTADERKKLAAYRKKTGELKKALAAATESEKKKKAGGQLISHLVAKGPPVFETTMSVEEVEDPGDWRVCLRGDPSTPGPEVKRGFLQVAMEPGAEVRIPEGESGRRQLADWIASPTNPLTARVVVNRIWHHLFGAGLVRTVDNVGSMGEPPSHPQLLDWLAIRFIEEGWSWKRSIRGMVLSETYQRASVRDIDARDPENRLLRGQNRRRLQAEVLRDTILVLGEGFDSQSSGRTMPDGLKSEFDFKPEKLNLRTVYLPVFRNKLDDLLEVFDVANPNIVVGRRPVSTLPSQALYLMNSPFVERQAKGASGRIREASESREERIEGMFEQTYGRPPTEEERAMAVTFLDQFPGSRESGDAASWAALQQALFAAVDFRYIE
ncbi:MAG: PSD1 and planctomycete cytochrome C domain-containing protein [Verrucomicrobiota bacterium]